MRRSDKAITDRAEMEAIIRDSQVCRLAMCDGEQPYIVPLCFGLLDGALYFHSATQGHKLDILRVNPRVCVEFDLGQEIVPAGESCQIGMRYRSVIAFGTATIVEDVEEKRRGLEAIVRQYVEMNDDIPDKALARVAVIRVEILDMTGKRSGD